MRIRSIIDAPDIKGKKILWRVDFNVPIKNGQIAEDYKIVRHLPTINFLLEKDCTIIVATHLGRPEPGRFDRNFSTEPLAARLGEMIGKEVRMLKGPADLATGTMVTNSGAGDVMMLENIRFEKGEEQNDKKTAKDLARLADIYVNDSFAVDHRSHASVDRVQDLMPSYAGLLLREELNNLARGLDPKSPLIAIVGGVKLETKIPLLKVLEKKAEKVLLGGALANNFLAAHGTNVGRSLVDKKSVAMAKKMLGKNIILPLDVLVSTSEQGGHAAVKAVGQVGDEDYIFDIGPATVRLYAGFIKKANTLLWNGPLGFFELKEFRHGTLSIARLVASRSKGKAYGIVGGGETVEALKQAKMFEYVDWVSTGGGAMLTYLGNEKMPGIKRLVK